MKLDVSCDLPCELFQARSAVKTLGLLNHVASPIMKFDPVELLSEHESLETRPYVMKTKLFGWLPLGLHTMDFSYIDAEGSFTMRDNGYSALCKKWDHKMSFTTKESGLLYRDRADIRAGALTPFVWLFAFCFYKHRQHRWKRLAIHNFQALNVGSESC